MTDKDLMEFLKKYGIVGLTRSELKKWKKAFQAYKEQGDTLPILKNYDSL